MNFLPEALEQYIEQFTTPESSVLHQLDRETHQKVLMPRMLAGHYQGRLLSMLSHMIKPKRVLEIGTFTGYSALCWAEGLAENGKVFTIDNNEELESMIQIYIQKCGFSNSINALIGNALDVIPTLHETWDLVFIDADKENYAAYYDLIFDQVRPGGFILADNVLWSGKVLDEIQLKKDADTKALHAFNQKIQSDERVENVLLGVRDGIMMVRKK